MTYTVFNLLVVNSIVFSVLFGCILLVKVVFKQKLSAAMQYTLWLVIILKLLVPVSFTMQWSPYVLLQNTQPNINIQTYDNNINIVVDDNPLLAAIRNISNTTTRNTFESGDNSSTGNESDAAARIVRIDLKALAVCVWIAGIVCFAVWVGTRSFQLKRMISRCNKGEAPQWMKDEFHRCKKELDIKRNIRLVLQGCLPVPAVMGALRPVLLVPDKLVNCKDIELVRHAFIHELMHYKRKDLWTIWILNIINAVYWFNPLIWLCIRLILRDMETACDSMVVQTLGAEHRKAYIRTILFFSGRQGVMRIHIAMSLNDGCTSMQKRIRGMYLARKTKCSARMAVTVIVCFLAFAGFTAGCQSLPGKYKAGNLPVYSEVQPNYSPGDNMQGLQKIVISTGKLAGLTIGIYSSDILSDDEDLAMIEVVCK